MAQRSSAVPLAWLYAALIVYASLYPFSGWRATPAPLLAFLVQPWHRWWSGFDLVSNLLGYLPLGVLVFGAAVRAGRSARAGIATATALAAALSFTMELLQNFLPKRVPSNVDLALNLAGAAAGALLALALHRAGALARWQTLRERWFVGQSAGGIALLLLWPLGLLFPTPVPLGLGADLVQLQDVVRSALEGTPLAPQAEAWLTLEPRTDPFVPAAEATCVALGLLAPCLVAFTVARPGWRRRLGLAAGAALLAALTMTLSTALNFGPDHALAWRTPTVIAGFVLGLALAGAFTPVPARAAAGLGLVVVTALALLVAHAPSDPYLADSLQAWEQGRFIRFHGAAQWVGWLWPYAVLVYLLLRFGARDAELPGTAS